jgi:hypothetical protein
MRERLDDSRSGDFMPDQMLGIAFVPMLATMEELLPSQLPLVWRDIEDR